MYALGEVVRALADNLKYKSTGGYKYHLCVCNVNRIYLWLCSFPRKYDFQITQKDCPQLPKEVSYVSLSSKLHIPDGRLRRAKPETMCIVTDSFWISFRQFVAAVPSLSEDDRKVLLTGLNRRKP
jgi:hypothetical protein